MKAARLIAAVFAAVGLVLMVGTVVLCLISLDAPAQMLGMPKTAMARSEEMMDALVEGDFASAAGVMYGQPDPGVDHVPDDPLNALVWDAFSSSISYEFTGVCYAEGSAIFRDASVTALDIPSVTEAIQLRADALMAERKKSAQTEEETQQETESSPEALAEQVMQEAVLQVLAEDTGLVTRTVTLKLIYRNGQWWVVPDQALLQAISGGVA